MSRIKNKVVIITGASSGLGEATALRLGNSGARLMLAARRQDRLKELTEAISKAGGTVAYKETDVTDYSQMEALAKETFSKYGRIDVLVNNAGLMPVSPFVQVKVEEWDRMIDVNIKGVLYGIAAVLPTLRSQKSGHIINLSSVGGNHEFSSRAVYCATKYAVRAISEGLRLESNGEIRSTNISPGAVANELTTTISDISTVNNINKLHAIAIDADAIARAIAFVLEQPINVNVNEMIIRPTKQAL